MEGRARVLVVDDEEVICQGCRRLLEEAGYRTASSTRGREAVRRLSEESFDAALIDLRMPDIDGFSVLAALRSLQPWAGGIAMTGYPSIEAVREAMSHGATEVLLKPFAPDAVRQATSSVLERMGWTIWRNPSRMKNAGEQPPPLGIEKVAVSIARDALPGAGVILYAELPIVGCRVRKDDVLIKLLSENHKVHNIPSPVDGVVTAVNERLVDEPDLLTQGTSITWAVEIAPAVKKGGE